MRQTRKGSGIRVQLDLVDRGNDLGFLEQALKELNGEVGDA